MARGTTTARFWPNYEIIELRTIQEVKHIFGPDGANVNQHNWCFIGVGGLHGTYTSLDELEEVFAGEHPEITLTRDNKAYVTILVVHPRLTVLKHPAPPEDREAAFGEIAITKDDIPYLRTLVTKTLKSVMESQIGNIDPVEFAK